MIDPKILMFIRPGEQWELRGTEYSDLVWLEHGKERPSEAEIAEALLLMQLPTASDIRSEASRRMQLMLGARSADHLAIIISNAQREATRLQAIRLGVPGIMSARDWTTEEAARAAELFGADAAIEAIRAASNVLESNLPADYADDANWPFAPQLGQ